MKKVFYVIIALLCICLIKFFTSSYNIQYEVGKYKVKEVALKGHMYFEVNYKGVNYNFMFYKGRKLFKKRVKSIKAEKVNGAICITPDIKGYDTYTICSKDGELLSLNAISEKEEKEIKDDFLYNENLTKDEFVLIWKYDGFYYLNGSEYKSINIFKKDRYSNDLMFKLDKYLIFPEYSEEYQFNKFVVLDMTNGKYEYIDINDNIHYDSYIVGNRKNNFYIFDNKSEKLYEINYKKNRSKIVGDEINGYIKYVDGKRKDAVVSDYKIDKIKYFETKSDLLNVKDNYFSYSVNNKIKTKYFINDDIKYIDSFKDNIYFIYKDNLYKYNNKEIITFAHYFEFNFNDKNIVFVYNK